MTPGSISDATRILGKPADMTDEQCSQLTIRDVTIEGQLAMVSAWYPTPAEVARLCQGAPIYLTVFGTVHPPVGLNVGVNEL